VTTPDPYNLERFVDAQRAVHERAARELQAGRKESHWMWFIFPQIKGLGRSPMAQKFAISSIAEAKAYLDHPVLGPRLKAFTRLVNLGGDRPIDEIFGYPDYLKFHSSMTLFAQATDANKDFMDALRKYFRGEFDRQTIERLDPAKGNRASRSLR
jgi:uncharacterized protein (DUF1810 family)